MFSPGLCAVVRLIRATDEETGERLSDQQLLDEAMAILLAGHGTVFLSLLVC